MSISRELLPESICVLSISGRLDHTQSNDLQAMLQSVIEDGYIRLVVDMSTVSYINSSGLRCLVSGWKQTGSLDGKLVLCGMDTRIQQVFKTVGFDRIFEVFTTRIEAIDHLTNA